MGSHWGTLGLASELCSNEWVFPAPVPTLSSAFPWDGVLGTSQSHSGPKSLGWDWLVERKGALGAPGTQGWGMHLILTLAFVCSGAAVTVETASALGVALSRCPSPLWGLQVSGVGRGGQGSGRAWLVPASSEGCWVVGQELGVSKRSNEIGSKSGL